MDTLKMQVNMEDVPEDEIDADIQYFLQDRFSSLRWRSELLTADPNALSNLTKKAERLFIYARTAIEYLDHRTPEVSVRRLKAIIGGSEGKTGMPALDALYTTVLQNAYDQESLEGDDVRKRVIALLAGLVVLQQDVTVKVLAPLMGLKEDAVIRTVQELRSILSCSSEDLRAAVIRPLHLTFAEFLMDKARCTNVALFIDRSACHLDFAEACLGTLTIHCVATCVGGMMMTMLANPGGNDVRTSEKSFPCMLDTRAIIGLHISSRSSSQATQH
jgi:hypothetical protein